MQVYIRGLINVKVSYLGLLCILFYNTLAFDFFCSVKPNVTDLKIVFSK